jgi:hypothetical protein
MAEQLRAEYRQVLPPYDVAALPILFRQRLRGTHDR